MRKKRILKRVGSVAIGIVLITLVDLALAMKITCECCENQDEGCNQTDNFCPYDFCDECQRTCNKMTEKETQE